MVLANQRIVDVERITVFAESLGTVTSILFVVLSARLALEELVDVLVPAMIFLAVLVVVVRPLAVAASTLGSELPPRDRAVAGSMAPRGIVAAGFAGVERLVPVTFLVILGSAVVYGLLAAPFLRRIQSGEPANDCS